MSENNSPDIDPSNNGSLIGTIKFAFNKLMQNVNGMLPARVIAYDADNNRVQVQLLIMVVTTNNELVSRPQVASLPVMQFGGGGFLINFKIQSGDLGWVIANDRDISLFLQSYKEAAPNTGRIKSFSDGVFMPNVMTGYTLDPTADMSIQNLDGTVKITLSAGQIVISAPLVTIDNYNPTTITPGTGILHVVGDITATGDITPHVP